MTYAIVKLLPFFITFFVGGVLGYLLRVRQTSSATKTTANLLLSTLPTHKLQSELENRKNENIYR